MQWSTLSTSLVGRINSIKMTINPKFLYLFQIVPIFDPNLFWDIRLSYFIVYLERQATSIE